MTLKFSNVITASGINKSVYGADALCFGDLQKMGLLKKDYRLEGWDYEGDSATIVWTVVGDVEFTDSYGETWKKGDVIEWPK